MEYQKSQYHQSGCDAAKAYAEPPQARNLGVPPAASTDPASLRGQFQALALLCERLSGQRNCLRDIADTILGAEPEEATNTAQPGRIQPVGGVTADVVSMFENAASLLNQIDRQIMRLQRVSS